MTSSMRFPPVPRKERQEQSQSPMAKIQILASEGHKGA